MKDLRKITRENLKNVQGGYTPECIANMYSFGCQLNSGPGLTYISVPGCPGVKRYCMMEINED